MNNLQNNQLNMEEKQLPHLVAFGKPNLPRDKQPCMFQILSWGGNSRCVAIQSSRQQLEQHQDQYSDQRKIKTQEGIIQNASIHLQGNKLTNNQQYFSRKRSFYNKEIKNQLYSYDKKHSRRSQTQDFKTTKNTNDQNKKSKQKAQSVKKLLDPNNPQDQIQIQKRKQRIKKFTLVTRDLPNSAYTTYFGKPAFETYGRGSSANLYKKSHNVMPHRGQNKPQYQQSYSSALIHGKKISQNNFVPRKPIEVCLSKQDSNIKQQIPKNLPLQAPDLINQVRFTCQQRKKAKESIPKQSKVIKTTTKKVSDNIKPSKKDKKNKNKKHQSMTNFNDGLKYMNIRDNLMEQLQKKKLQNSRLAYKVTQCYPYTFKFGQTNYTNTANNWEKVTPAGVKLEEGEHVADIFSK